MYSLEGDQKQHYRLVILLFVIALISAIGFTVFNRLHSESKTKPASKIVVQKPIPITYSLSSHMLYVGEVFWGRAIETRSNRSPLKYAFPFSGLTLADKGAYDAWIGDMECPITDSVIPYQTQVDDLKFNCRPEFLPEAAKWFDVFTLANNHTNNVEGTIGLAKTRQNLVANHIQYFGDYNMANLNNICDVIAMPASLKGSDGSIKKTFFPIALCGYDYVGNVQPTQAEYDVMKQYSKVIPVIAMPHAGIEYLASAEDAKVTIYHALIDNGADVVIGAHPHVVQNSENYKGHLIDYSTGNFMFDQQILGKSTIETLGVGLDLSINDQTTINAYQSVADCSIEHDTCLNQISAKLPARPTIAVKYNTECFYAPNYYPLKADAATCDDIMTRSNITQSMANLNPTW